MIQAQTELTERLPDLKGADKVAVTALIEQLAHINGYNEYLLVSKQARINFCISVSFKQTIASQNAIS